MNHLLLTPHHPNGIQLELVAADPRNVCKRPTLTDGGKQMNMEKWCCVVILSDNPSPVVGPVAQRFQPCSYEYPLGHLFSFIMQKFNPHDVHRYHACPTQLLGSGMFLVYKVTMLTLPKPMLQTIPAIRAIKNRFACITPHEGPEYPRYWNGAPQLHSLLLNILTIANN